MSDLKIGEAVGDFTLPGTGGDFALSAQGRTVVLYFYPKDDTPGCTIESGEFSKLLPEFDAAGAVVVGVSRDSISSHEDFRQKFNYAHHLLSDADEKLCNQFTVLKEKEYNGKKVFGISRSTFVIDKAGVLRGEWRDIREAGGHAAEVLAMVRGL